MLERQIAYYGQESESEIKQLFGLGLDFGFSSLDFGFSGLILGLDFGFLGSKSESKFENSKSNSKSNPKIRKIQNPNRIRKTRFLLGSDP